MISPELVRKYFGDHPCEIEIPYSEVQAFIPDEAHDKAKYKDIAPEISKDEGHHEELWKWKAAHCFVKKDLLDFPAGTNLSELKRSIPKSEIVKENNKSYFIYPVKKPIELIKKDVEIGGTAAAVGAALLV